MSADVKETLKHFRKDKVAKQESETLVDELGEGVEPVPVEPEKVDINTLPNLDFSDAKDIQSIVKAIKDLPASEDVNNQLSKIDKYEEYAKKIWKMKKAEDESFDIQMRTVERVENRKMGDATIEKLIWKLDKDGRIETHTKKFHYTGITMQERDELVFLESQMQDAHFRVIQEGVVVNRMTRDPNATEEQFSQYAADKVWQRKKLEWEKTIQDYYIAVFHAYFGGTDEDIRSMVFDDIINYSEVALYKGGVKSPK